ncbi:MAG: hypothetical protein OXH70_07880 [Acidobacteria bacterium]|nr:hypothetical protein [Acidobacteriota bacterium]MCY3931622.1 hypothetical protein [Acidobacteriota bacterium]
MTLRSANIALGRLERGEPAANRPALWKRASAALDAADAATPIDDAAGRQKLARAERRYRTLRRRIEDGRPGQQRRLA